VTKSTKQFHILTNNQFIILLFLCQLLAHFKLQKLNPFLQLDLPFYHLSPITIPTGKIYIVKA